MELNNETFAEFVDRLRLHNKGEGVNQHYTASPIFEVQEHREIAGLDPDFADYWRLTSGDGELSWTSLEDLVDELRLEDEEGLDSVLSVAGVSSLKELTDMDEVYIAGLLDKSDLEYRLIYCSRNWVHINSHLTREGAEAFIKRKQHDYGKLRVYVNSLYWCAEFKTIVNGILDGQIGWLNRTGPDGQPLAVEMEG